MSVARLVRAALSVEVKGRLMSTMTQHQQAVEVTGGVDTHKDSHTAAALDSAGRLLGSARFPATGAGYGQLLDWLRGFGLLVRVGVEGTGAYGAGLARHLAAAGVVVVEVDRPDRKARRWQGRSDPVDAEAAARAALAGRSTGVPKGRDGRVEALRSLRVARRGAVAHRADVIRQMKALVVTAPEPVRAELSGLAAARLVASAPPRTSRPPGWGSRRSRSGWRWAAWPAATSSCPPRSGSWMRSSTGSSVRSRRGWSR